MPMLFQTYKFIILVFGGALCGFAVAWLLYAAMTGALLWLAPIAGAVYGFSIYRRRYC